VAKLFKVKKRPLSQPLSIAIVNFTHIYKYVGNIPDSTKILAKKFLPGPLTIVVKKSKVIPDIVTAKKNDIGIRIPDSKIVLSLLKILKKPIVIPSANIHRHLSPTNAQQVLKYLDGKVELILDGGKTKHQKESTVVSCINDKVKILRDGVITAKEIFMMLSKKY
jgi:L-threonylcarbamoyladenylate synthase